MPRNDVLSSCTGATEIDVWTNQSASIGIAMLVDLTRHLQVAPSRGAMSSPSRFNLSLQ